METAAAAAASTPQDLTPLQIGDCCHVTWRDGTTSLAAKVIERRRAKSSSLPAPVAAAAVDPKTTDEPPLKKSKMEGEEKAEDYEYYVHYVEHDR
jgi:hypothetical protein